MFYSALSFNGDVSSWDVSQVTNMESMFSSASSFNGDVSSWDVSQVTNMKSMFASASSFSQKMCWVLNPDVSMSNVVLMTDGALVCDCPEGATYSDANGVGTCGWTTPSSTAAPTPSPTAAPISVPTNKSGALSTVGIVAIIGGAALLIVMGALLVHRWMKNKYTYESSNVEKKDFHEVEQSDHSEMVSEDPICSEVI